MATELNQPVGPKLIPNTPPAPAKAARPAAPVQDAQNAPQVTGTQGSRGDTVSISAQGLKASDFTPITPESGATPTPPKAVRDVTDDHQLVVKFVDPKSNEVVRQVPSEELLRLKQAVGDLVEENRSDA